jgi:hypothetical protein
MKQETIEEAAEIFVNNRFTKQICGDESYPDILASRSSIVESHILFAKWQQERIIDFLHSEITERRDYSASKMCEVIAEFIENDL